MAKLFGLTAEQQQRLARVADKVERQPIQRANQQSGTSKPSPSFWVELTEEDPDNPGRYAWKVVDYVDHEWTDRDPEIASPEGEYSAIEANLGSGMVGQRVELHFYGYDAEGKPRYLFGSPPPVILAKITGSTRDGDNYRWKYTMRLMKKVKTEGGYSGWEEINGEDVTGYNLVERENGDSGTVSGITITDEVTGILAAPNGLIRPVYRIAVDGGDPEYWFDWQNIPVVECDE